MTGQEIGMACHGLRGMSNLLPVVQKCMFLLTNKVETALSLGLQMEPSEIAMAIGGMCSMTGKYVFPNFT